MYIYYIRWTIISLGEIAAMGSSEFRCNDSISSMEDIEDVEKLILEQMAEHLDEIEEDTKVLIDFYSLLRKE